MHVLHAAWRWRLMAGRWDNGVIGDHIPPYKVRQGPGRARSGGGGRRQQPGHVCNTLVCCVQDGWGFFHRDANQRAQVEMGGRGRADGALVPSGRGYGAPGQGRGFAAAGSPAHGNAHAFCTCTRPAPHARAVKLARSLGSCPVTTLPRPAPPRHAPSCTATPCTAPQVVRLALEKEASANRLELLLAKVGAGRACVCART